MLKKREIIVHVKRGQSCGIFQIYRIELVVPLLLTIYAAVEKSVDKLCLQFSWSFFLYTSPLVDVLEQNLRSIARSLPYHLAPMLFSGVEWLPLQSHICSPDLTLLVHMYNHLKTVSLWPCWSQKHLSVS